MKEFIALVLNYVIRKLKIAPMISDGYHTFHELYEHRIMLWITLCRMVPGDAWRSVKHSDGSNYAGWFLLGLNREKGKQITYHIPIKYYDLCGFAETLVYAPEFDGHKSDDVLDRLAVMRANIEIGETMDSMLAGFADKFNSRQLTDVLAECSKLTDETAVSESKRGRLALDNVIQYLKGSSRQSRERSLAITKIQEGVMWLGMDLKDIGATPNPYPESYNPESKKIEPTADGLKL